MNIKVSLILVFFVNVYIYAVQPDIVLKVVNIDMPPIASPELPGGGLGIQLFYNEVKNKGIDFELMWANSERAYMMIKEGEADISIGWLVSDERLKEVKFSDSIETQGYSILYRKKDDFDWKTVDDLSGLKIGLVKGVIAYGENILEAEASGKIITERVVELWQNICKLISGRIDIVIGDELILKHLINNIFPEEKEQLVFHKRKFPSASYCLIFRKDISPEIITIFNDAIKSLKKDNKLLKTLGYD